MFEQLDDQGAVPVSDDVITAVVREGRRRQRKRQIAIVGASAVVLLSAAAVVLLQGDTPPSLVQTAQPETESSAGPVSTSIDTTSTLAVTTTTGRPATTLAAPPPMLPSDASPPDSRLQIELSLKRTTFSGNETVDGVLTVTNLSDEEVVVTSSSGEVVSHFLCSLGAVVGGHEPYSVSAARTETRWAPHERTTFTRTFDGKDMRSASERRALAPGAYDAVAGVAVFTDAPHHWYAAPIRVYVTD